MVCNEHDTGYSSKIPLLCQQEVFEEVFDGLENILAKMLSDIMDVDYCELKDQIVLRKSKDLDVKFEEERRSFFASIDCNGVLNLKVNKNSNLGRIFKDMNVMFLHFDWFEKYYFKLSAPLIKFCIKRDRNIANCFGQLFVAFLNMKWCEKIYQEKQDDDLPCFIRWGALFRCNDILRVKKISEELITNEEQILFIKRLEKLM